MSNLRARPCEEAAILAIRPAGNCADSAKPWVLVATILASSIAYIDESVVNVPCRRWRTISPRRSS
jgi:hypothetical protein